jgi:hypothetical protein
VDAERVELGVIAFGESTRELFAPGVPVPEARARLDAFRRERPRGEGRTDAVCALELARDWLSDAPRGSAREIVLLTDGDLPHSGRFLDCKMARRRGSREAAARCEQRRNRSVCPASHRFRRSDGASDQIQLASFVRRARRDVDVHVLVFERDRPARPYRSLAQRTGGALVRVASAAAIEAALPALVARQIRGVWARNLGTGDETPNLYDPSTHRFDGVLPLAPGANDVELRVESGRGVASLYRYRVYSLPGALGHFLEALRQQNRDLGARLEGVRLEGAEERAARPVARRVEVGIATEHRPPAAVSDAIVGGLDEGSAR